MFTDKMPVWATCDSLQNENSRSLCTNREFIEWFRNEFYIPESYKETGLMSTKIFVQFVISKNGNVEKVKLIRGIHPEIDKVAIKTIENMPNWIPGKLMGEPIDITYNLPIIIELK